MIINAIGAIVNFALLIVAIFMAVGEYLIKGKL